MRKSAFLIAILAVLIMFPFGSLQSKEEFTEGLKEKIILKSEFRRLPKVNAKSNHSDLFIDAWIDGNIITVDFDRPMFNPTFNISIKDDESGLVVYNNYATIDANNTLVLVFERDPEKNYYIEISNEDGFLYGYF